jgi:CDP-diacylglycerol--glycerol-3-phosphate 3-phosphatidyltransferase
VNLPNQLTLSRVFMIPIFVLLLEVAYLERMPASTRAWLCIAAALVFIVAAITDLIDGMLARRWNMVTDFGKLFDPLADKLLVTSALILFVKHDLFGAWVVVIILCREFIVTGLRSLGESSNRVIAADNLGKAKTVTQIVAIIYCLVHLILVNAAKAAGENAWIHAMWADVGERVSLGLVDLLVGLALIITVASGYSYLKNNWDLVSSKAI